MDDEGLRRRLGGADPASCLPPADPSAVAHLLEATMSDLLTDETRADGVHHRSPLTWLVGAAAVVLLGGGLALIVSNRGHDAPVTAPAPTSSAASTTALTAALPTGRCALPSADTLRHQDLAFEGTVTSLAGGVAVLVPTRVYTGAPGTEVTVAAPSSDLQDLLQAVDLSAGRQYLIAATEGRVAVCGLSGAPTAALSDLYAQAFSH